MHVTPERSFRFIDLFAGIGGFRFGLEPLGGECVFSVEWDKFARQTYAAWHDEDPDDEARFARDIEDVDPAAVPDHDVLAAGFPCQPFSLAGVSKKNSLGRAHGFDDPTQGTLFFNIKEIAKTKRPAVLLLENVKNLLSHDKGQTWATIESTLDDLGYSVAVDVIDARHWVPQHRERVLIVAYDKDVVPEDLPFEFPPPPDAAPTLEEVLSPDEVDEKYTLSTRLWTYLQEYRAKHEARGNGFGYSKFGPGDVARTMSARYHKDGSEILIGQPDTEHKRPRRLTPVEAQRLMGFDEPSVLRPSGSLPIVVSDTQAYRQFGNAVVPAVVNHVAAQALGHAERHVEVPWEAAPGRVVEAA